MFDFVTSDGFPWLETLHVIGFSLWVGSIFVLDLKLLGLSKRAPFYHYHMTPWAWVGFAIVVVTGLLFVAGNPAYLSNPAFQIKLALIVVAGLVALIMHSRLVATHFNAAEDMPTPLVAKVAGGASLLLWLGVLIFARMIPYQMIPPQ